MFTILLDEQLTGYLRYIRSLAESEGWEAFARQLGVRFTNFPEVGLANGTPDRDVWIFCQSHGYYLLTDNRNAKGNDSLEETIRHCNTPTSLPVFNIGDRDRFAHDGQCALSVIVSMFDRLMDAQNLRGTGRHYLP